MSRILVILTGLLMFGAWPQVQAAPSDAYLIFYATHDGKTGHVGLAFDQQVVKVSDCARCPDGVRYDTVKTGELVYFDLWPGTDEWSYNFFFGTVPAKYNRLPTSSAAVPMTVISLLRKGLPHAMKDAVDGLLRIPVSPTQNEALIDFMQALVDADRPFSLYEFNCSDFAYAGLSQILPGLTGTDELVLTRQATTPNRLWRAVVKTPRVVVLKNPGALATGKFNTARIFTTLNP